MIDRAIATSNRVNAAELAQALAPLVNTVTVRAQSSKASR